MTVLTKFALVSSVAVLSSVEGALDASCFQRYSASRIVGGTDAVKREFPFQVSLQDDNGFHFCGGTLVGAKWVLTAAHCGNVDYVEIGRHTLSGNDICAEKIKVKRTIGHPRYNEFSLENDIAVLELETSSEYGPAKVYTPSDPASFAQAGSDLTVSGWGTLEAGGTAPDVLQKVTVPVVSMQSCRQSYGQSEILDSMMCAGLSEGGKDSCQGDSGGPLFKKLDQGLFVVVGIVSWGYGCADPNMPGVYTRVASHQDFICSKTGLVCANAPAFDDTPSPNGGGFDGFTGGDFDSDFGDFDFGDFGAGNNTDGKC
jgi:trypsin